jgi:hypothetical protein
MRLDDVSEVAGCAGNHRIDRGQIRIPHGKRIAGKVGLCSRESDHMARKRTSAALVRTKWQLADRLRTIRTDLYGERSLTEFAGLMGVPVRTWYSYESGVTLPAETLLKFVELTSVEPSWLLHGEGEKFQQELGPLDPFRALSRAQDEDHDDPLRPRTLPFPGRERVASLELALASCDVAETSDSACLAIPDLSAPARRSASRTLEPWFFAAPTTWRPNQTDSRCVRVDEDAMVPIVAPGAFIGFSESDEAPIDLEGRLVVARIKSRPIVRWFHCSGEFGVLRAENPAFSPRSELVALDGRSEEGPIRRVLWVGTPH